MAFCMQCGQQIPQGATHICGDGQQVANSGTQAEASRPLTNDLTKAMKQVDGNVVLKLLKDPQYGLNLNPDKDFIYGILGLVASILGFTIWAGLLGMRIDSLFSGLLGLGGFGGDSIGGAFTGRMLLTAILSIAALHGMLWLLGSWQGTNKLSFKAFITYAGSMHYLSGAGFVVAGLCALISLISFSFLLILINVSIMLVLSVIVSIDIFGVYREKRMVYTASAIALYMVILMIVTKIIL
ncbi:hypothetical protein [Paenibacillus mendelii]|uniref:Yip1 domain-containing protein n=1 Tax=Paenibacillus mendelii TaxID=206163 RepID=A0ABV6J3V4_9BACL|nr:hypothetical protein [Paenibacillus mendelii]MCQ6561946.1 hypothetical protein [Paenibacillus mendelii]